MALGGRCNHLLWTPPHLFLSRPSPLAGLTVSPLLSKFDCIHEVIFFVQLVRTMLLRPNQMKRRKCQKNIRAVLPRQPTEPVQAPKLSFGNYGIYATESLRLKACHIASARMAILKEVGKKDVKIWVTVFPHIPVTKKPLGVRMGKGKGAVDHFVAHVRAGKMLFEFNCPSESTARLAFKQVKYKLPLKAKFTRRDPDKMLDRW